MTSHGSGPTNKSVPCAAEPRGEAAATRSRGSSSEEKGLGWPSPSPYLYYQSKKGWEVSPSPYLELLAPVPGLVETRDASQTNKGSTRPPPMVVHFLGIVLDPCRSGWDISPRDMWLLPWLNCLLDLLLRLVLYTLFKDYQRSVIPHV